MQYSLILKEADEVREDIKEAIQLLHEVRIEQALKNMGNARYKVERIAL